MKLYKASGFNADSFERSKVARVGMADALTRTEDWLELTYPRRWVKERPAIQTVRRRLEEELFP